MGSRSLSLNAKKEGAGDGVWRQCYMGPQSLGVCLAPSMQEALGSILLPPKDKTTEPLEYFGMQIRPCLHTLL